MNGFRIVIAGTSGPTSTTAADAIAQSFANELRKAGHTLQLAQFYPDNAAKIQLSEQVETDADAQVDALKMATAKPDENPFKESAPSAPTHKLVEVSPGVFEPHAA